jgi:transposase
MMKRFIEGESRHQTTLLPECLDDYITEDNPVRAIEAFIDELDLLSLGFCGLSCRSQVNGFHGLRVSALRQ